MNTKCCYINDFVLRKYISETYKKESLLLGSGYEVVCALLMKLLLEEIYKTECLIGFKTKQTYDRNKHNLITSTKQCKNFFKNIEDKDTLIDFSISPIHSYSKKRNKIYAWTFQAKRFGRFQDKKDTNGLIEYLFVFKRKYAKTNSALVIFFDGHKGINPEKVCHSKKLKDFPFETIFFIDTNTDKTGHWYLKMGQMWPVYGYNAYDVYKAIKEGVLENISSKYK
ncbi:MAG: hypothetical protein KAV41_02220 [Candidatus Pacebacteria bacterium]|nr:hypothetical protein [Candidatus Paceibacterota bacterium]